MKKKQILHVDSFDAMTSGRPYRKALSKEEALEELKRCAGTQFDAELTQRFIRMVKKKEDAALLKK